MVNKDEYKNVTETDLSVGVSIFLSLFVYILCRSYTVCFIATFVMFLFLITPCGA